MLQDGAGRPQFREQVYTNGWLRSIEMPSFLLNDLHGWNLSHHMGMQLLHLQNSNAPCNEWALLDSGRGSPYDLARNMYVPFWVAQLYRSIRQVLEVLQCCQSTPQTAAVVSVAVMLRLLLTHDFLTKTKTHELCLLVSSAARAVFRIMCAAYACWFVQ